MCTSTRAIGRWVKYCTYRQALRELDDQQVARGPADPGGGVGRVQRHEQRDGEPDQQEDEVGVQLADQFRVEAGASRFRVAAVRAAAGDDGPDRQHGPGHRGDAGDQQHEGTAQQRLTDPGSRERSHRIVAPRRAPSTAGSARPPSTGSARSAR